MPVMCPWATARASGETQWSGGGGGDGLFGGVVYVAHKIYHINHKYFSEYMVQYRVMVL